MSILCKVNNIPVFYSSKDARSFGQQYGLTNFHTHEHDGRIGYMPGNNHAHAMRVIKGVVNQSTKLEDDLLSKWAGDNTVGMPTVTQQQIAPLSPEENTIPQTITTPTPSPPSGGGGGGY